MDFEALQANFTPVDLGFGKPQQKKKKNFWLDQISTVGGIVGGIGGSLLAPIAGTAGGAGAGSALGEAIENIISGESVGKNVLKEGALGAVFGAGPMKLAKGGVALAAGKGLQGASQAAMTPLRATAGKKVLQAADRTITKQFKFTPSQLTNFSKRHGEDATSLIKRYGINNADDVAAKAIEPLQSAFDDVITKIPTISSQSLSSSLKKVYDPLVKSANNAERALGQQLQSQADEIIKRSGKNISAAKVNDLRKSFDGFVKYTTRGTPDHNVSKMTADALRTTLQNAADKAGIGFQGKTFKEIGRDLSKLYDLDEIVGRQANLGRGSSPLSLTNMMGMAAGGAAGGPAGLAGGALLTGAINSGAGRSAARKGAEALGNRLTQAGTRAAGQSPRGIATRLGASGVLRGGSQGEPQSLEDALLQSSLENQTNQAYMPNASMNSAAANMGSQYPQDGGMSTNPYPRENLIADIQRDPQNAEEYIKHYAQLQEIFGTPEAKPLNSTAAGVVTDLTNGLANINALSQRFQQSGANKPIIGNLLAANPFNTDAQTLRADIARVKQVIGKALEGGVLRKEDEIKYQKILPTLNDTDEVAQNKIMAIASDLQRKLALYQQNIGGGGGGTLEDALMQYAQ